MWRFSLLGKLYLPFHPLHTLFIYAFLYFWETFSQAVVTEFCLIEHLTTNARKWHLIQSNALDIRGTESKQAWIPSKSLFSLIYRKNTSAVYRVLISRSQQSCWILYISTDTVLCAGACACTQSWKWMRAIIWKHAFWFCLWCNYNVKGRKVKST